MGQVSPLISAYDPALAEASLEGDSDDEIALIARLSESHALPEGTQIVTRFGDVVTLRVNRSRIAELAECDAVTAVEAPRRLRKSTETGESDWDDMSFDDGDDDTGDDTDDVPDPVESSEPGFYTRRPPGLAGTGKGVVIGVLDWGCDFAHTAFRREDGTTRLLALWDQRANEHSSSANRWGYGRIFDAEKINRALREADPYEALDYRPADSAHGTHVMDIAAGSKSEDGLSGVAPDTDLVFVHLSRTTKVLGRGNLGDSATVLEALDFVFSTAGDRPCVVNMSVGAHGGPHDGTTLLEQGIDRAVSLENCRAVINSGGNYLRKRAHAQGRLNTGEEKQLRFRVPAGDPTDSELEIWYPGVDRITVTVLGPAGDTLAEVRPGQNSPLISRGRAVGHIYHYARQSLNGDHHIDLFLKPRVPEGIWELRLKGDVIVDGHYHAWIERDRGLQPKFLHTDVNTNSTTGTLCNGRLSITVGAFNPHREDGSLGSFSSAGPTRDGRVKPELVAPGVRIRAARATPRGTLPQALYINKSGTSMAAPHVTGAIALLFEAAGKPLSITDTRALLLSSTNRGPLDSGVLRTADLHRVGYGYLDLVAVEKAGQEWGMAQADAEQTETTQAATAQTNGKEVGTEVTDEKLVDFESEQLADLETDTTVLQGDSVDLADLATEESDVVFLEEGPVFGPESSDPVTRRDTIRAILASNHDRLTPFQLQELAFSAIGASENSALSPRDISTTSYDEAIGPGDLLVRFAPFEGIRHSAIVISESPESPVDLAARGVPVEWAGSGTYVEVLETPLGGGPVRSIGRRLTDSWGRMLRGQKVLHPNAASFASESELASESRLSTIDTQFDSDTIQATAESDLYPIEQAIPVSIVEEWHNLPGGNGPENVDRAIQDSWAVDSTLNGEWFEQDRPMTPAHAGGAMGELDAAFALGQRGFSVIIGPGGPGGHRLTASGFDIVAFNPATSELWIVDNKASGGTSTVQGASALTTNLQQNLVDAIRQVRSAQNFPHKTAVVQRLEAALSAVRAGQPLPTNVSRYITNAGGYHSGISRRLQQQGVRFLDLTGPTTRSARRGDIQQAQQQGVRPGRPTTHQGGGSQTRRGTTQQGRGNLQPITPPLGGSGGSRARGAAAAGLTVGLAGLNFGLNWLNDRRQQQRVQERLNQIEPAIQRERQSRPDHGILLTIYYHQVQAPPDSLIRPGPVFYYIDWAAGRSQDEAAQNLRSQSVIRPAPPAGSRVHASQMWIPPLQPASIQTLQTPFPRAGFGIFAVNAAILQDVEWGGVTGFDDEGQTRLQLPSSPTPRFILLDPPQTINWFWGRQLRQTSIPIVHRRTATGQHTVKAVDLDPRNPFGNVAAVPIFPYDAFTDRLFGTAPKTRDNLNQLAQYVNIRKMRWVRPENIVTVQAFR